MTQLSVDNTISFANFGLKIRLFSIRLFSKGVFGESFILNIHPSIIANKHELEDMVLKKKSFLLKGWRYEVFGKDYIKLIS